MSLALKIFMRNYGDFVDVILLYPSITHTHTHTHTHTYTYIYIYIYICMSHLEFVFTCLFNDTDTTSEYEVCSNSIRIGIACGCSLGGMCLQPVLTCSYMS